jgi:NAD/NADP transhydrogenase alpha subunit
VAGLAAIGTSTSSLGAITCAFDVRPEVAEQIESMGAEFVYLDFAEAGAGRRGDAKAMPQGVHRPNSAMRSCSANWPRRWTSSSPPR